MTDINPHETEPTTPYVPTGDAVIVFTKQDCMPCRMTLKKLNKAGIAHETVSLDEVPGALDYIKSLGYKSAPVVVASADNHWSGLRPDRIIELK